MSLRPIDPPFFVPPWHVRKLLGDCTTAVAGGAESMSRAPYASPALRFGARRGDTPVVDTLLGALHDPFHRIHMGTTAENVARKPRQPCPPAAARRYHDDPPTPLIGNPAVRLVQSLAGFVGQPAIVSPSLLIDQEMTDRFALVTHDTQWIHVDRERAIAQSPYGHTIAHGFLVLSLLTCWQASCIAFPGAAVVLNYGFDKVRFTAPIRSGARVSASFALAQVAETRPGEARCSWNVTVQADDARRPSVHADWLIMARYE
ncbi:MAG TPA: MaoC/PaaZ C-terminal domain-containing protein [Bordetella sp.]|nr:MaoC/PaaZ C-terminal domain-containing protein [Bordetella sp.]